VNQAEDLKKDIIQYGYVYDENGIELKSGKISKEYFDLRVLTSRGDTVVKIVNFLLDMIPVEQEYIASVELGAVMPATAVITAGKILQGRNLKNMIVRKEKKGHGVGGFLTGAIAPIGADVILIEDLITSGESSMNAINNLYNAGYRVSKLLGIVDRGCDGGNFRGIFEQKLYEKDIQLETLFDFEEVLAMK